MVNFILALFAFLFVLFGFRRFFLLVSRPLRGFRFKNGKLVRKAINNATNFGALNSISFSAATIKRIEEKQSKRKSNITENAN